MGNNNRFKLSELMPKTWFYKLMKDMGKLRKQQWQQNSNKKHNSNPAPTTTTAGSPRPPLIRSSKTPIKSAGNRLRHRTTVDSKSSTNTGYSTASGTCSFSPELEFRTDQVLLPDDSLDSSWHAPSRSSLSKAANLAPPPELDLRPINTKPATTPRKMMLSSPSGVGLRLRSPRISTRKSVSSSSTRRSGSTARRSRAVVKASVDPWTDFKESMEEMIAENNIRASTDLEELLACYLCLNSDEYHALIIHVFKQIWLDLK